jgi:hypothetical protein
MGFRLTKEPPARTVTLVTKTRIFLAMVVAAVGFSGFPLALPSPLYASGMVQNCDCCDEDNCCDTSSCAGEGCACPSCPHSGTGMGILAGRSGDLIAKLDPLFSLFGTDVLFASGNREPAEPVPKIETSSAL